MTKMLMLLIVEDSNSRSEMDQNSDSRAIAKAKEGGSWVVCEKWLLYQKSQGNERVL